MYDPRSILIYTRRLTVSRLDDGDYSGPKPWSVVLNPLRYAISFGLHRRWSINRRQRAYIAVANVVYRIRTAFRSPA